MINLKMNCLLLCSMFLTTSIIAQIPMNELIACYSFEGNTEDPIGEHHGTLMGNANLNSNVLNVGFNDEDAFKIPGSILDGLDDFTVAMAIKFNAFYTDHMSAGTCIFSCAQSESVTNVGNLVYVKNQLPGGQFDLSNCFYWAQYGTLYYFNNINLEPGLAYHLAFSKSGNELRLYINGEEQNSGVPVSVPNQTLVVHDDGLIFGQDQDALTGGFETFQSLNGTLDDLFIYSRALSQAEVLNVMNTSHEQATSTTELIDEENLRLRVYPNPSSTGEFTLALSDDPVSYGLLILDQTGKIVHEEKLKATKKTILKLSFLENGIYNLVLFHEQRRLSTRLVILK